MKNNKSSIIVGVVEVICAMVFLYLVLRISGAKTVVERIDLIIIGTLCIACTFTIVCLIDVNKTLESNLKEIKKMQKEIEELKKEDTEK